MTEWEHSGRKVEVEMQTSATTEQLWLAWADPDRISQWLVDGAEGVAIPGGSVTWRFADFDVSVPYQVVEAVPERHLVLSTGGDHARILEVRIESVDGRAKLHLIESGYPEDDDDIFTSVVSGWQIATAILRVYLERFFGRSKITKLLARPTKAEYEKIYAYFTVQEKVGTWIGDMSGVSQDAPYRLRLESGGELTGRYLAVTGREILLGADQIDGTVELKAFPKGDGRALGIRVLSWRLDEPQMADLAGVMLSALNRLSQELGDG